MTISDLPALNAALNTVCAVLLVMGYRAIKRGDEGRHKALMLGAFGVSCAFLASYLIYHYYAGHVKFPGTGVARTAYFALLISHIVLAAVQVPMVLGTVISGLLDKRAWHRWLAWPTYCVWLYVSVTGVMVYVILYHLYGARAGVS